MSHLETKAIGPVAVRRARWLFARPGTVVRDRPADLWRRAVGIAQAIPVARPEPKGDVEVHLSAKRAGEAETRAVRGGPSALKRADERAYGVCGGPTNVVGGVVCDDQTAISNACRRAEPGSIDDSLCDDLTLQGAQDFFTDIAQKAINLVRAPRSAVEMSTGAAPSAPLRWYEYGVALLPVVLAFTGAIGLAVGPAACALNLVIMHSGSALGLVHER